MATSARRSLLNLMLIALAAVLLLTMFLQSAAALAPGRSLRPIDALFMATSAVTLCGLSPRDPGAALSPLGLMALMLTSQVFGLLMILASYRLVVSAATLARTRRRLVGLVFIAQALGAGLLLIAAGVGEGGLSAGSALSAVALAVKAVCTGGPTMPATEMRLLERAWAAHLVVMPLMFLGVVSVQFRSQWRADRACDASTGNHSAITPWNLMAAAYLVGVTAIMLAQLAPAFYGFFKLGLEAGNGQARTLTLHDCGAALADASFTTLSAMSSGISVQRIGDMTPAARIVVMTLMLLGGLPGSAAGGIGLWAVSDLARSVWSGVTGGTGPGRAGLMLAIALWVVGLAGVGWFALSIIEPYPMGTLLFESVSAVTSSGLSTGVTGDLTTGGKGVLIALMLLGRFGTLTLWARAGEA